LSGPVEPYGEHVIPYSASATEWSRGYNSNVKMSSREAEIYCGVTLKLPKPTLTVWTCGTGALIDWADVRSEREGARKSRAWRRGAIMMGRGSVWQSRQVKDCQNSKGGQYNGCYTSTLSIPRNKDRADSWRRGRRTKITGTPIEQTTEHDYKQLNISILRTLVHSTCHPFPRPRGSLPFASRVRQLSARRLGPTVLRSG
jgi:hypothetical protein